MCGGVKRTFVSKLCIVRMHFLVGLQSQSYWWPGSKPCEAPKASVCSNTLIPYLSCGSGMLGILSRTWGWWGYLSWWGEDLFCWVHVSSPSPPPPPPLLQDPRHTLMDLIFRLKIGPKLENWFLTSWKNSLELVQQDLTGKWCHNMPTCWAIYPVVESLSMSP